MKAKQGFREFHVARRGVLAINSMMCNLCRVSFATVRPRRASRIPALASRPHRAVVIEPEVFQSDRRPEKTELAEYRLRFDAAHVRQDPRPCALARFTFAHRRRFVGLGHWPAVDKVHHG